MEMFMFHFLLVLTVYDYLGSVEIVALRGNMSDSLLLFQDSQVLQLSFPLFFSPK